MTSPLLPATVRERFHRPQGHYFLSHSAGLMPKAAKEFIETNVFKPWQEKGGQSWPDWLTVLDRFHQGLGTILSAPANQFCAQTNLSAGLVKIFSALPAPKKRNIILMSEEDFPTTGFVLQQAERWGWERRFIPRGSDLSDLELWQDQMDECVGVVFATHVFSNGGARAPIHDICQIARERDILSILDLAQSAGGIEIDLSSIRPDFAVGSGLKYLCGGPGACWLYVDGARLERWQPTDVGWFSHQDPYEMDIHNFTYAENAWRFMGGTPSVLPFAMGVVGLEIVQEYGSAQIEAHNQALLQRLIDGLPPDRVVSQTRPHRRGNHLLVRVCDPEKQVEILAHQNILCDVRNQALRFSLHLYNNENDVAALLTALAPMLVDETQKP